MSTPERGPAVAKRQLRSKLRRLRKESGITQTDVAKRLDWSVSKILRIENGQVPVQTSDLVALLTLYAVTDDDTEVKRLIELARAARNPSVTSRYHDVLSREFAEFLEYEASASLIRQYETKLVPGILQIDGYANPIVKVFRPNDSEEVQTQVVRSRLERAKDLTLTGPGGPKMFFIIDEAALRRGVGNESGTANYAAMIRVLENVKKLNTVGRIARKEAIQPSLNPNISIQVVPLDLGAYPAMRGPFEHLEFADDDDDIVYLENPNGDVLLKDTPDETMPYLETFLELEKTIPKAVVTNELIDVIIQFMKEGRNGVPSTAPRTGPEDTA
jgi:transcriptional regulator with XRE-family HTH domain